MSVSEPVQNVPSLPSGIEHRQLWLTAKEAAEYLKVKKRTINAWVNEGKLKGYALSGTERKVWRFKYSDLNDMLLSSSVQPCSKRVRLQ